MMHLYCRWCSKAVFLKLFSSWPPSVFDLTVCPPPPPTLLTYEKKLLYFHVVDLYIGIYLYYFYLQYFTVLKILFRYNTLFADPSGHAV
jgi:hypothetical protein